MRNLLFNISYNGTNYHGYQVQENALTVSEVLQDAIEIVLKIREPITGCSRTDTGVHANNYYFNMKTNAAIPPEKLVIALNNHLPSDIAVHSCLEVPMKFHARYHCVSKEYLYQIWNAPVKNPFLQEMAYHYKYPIDEHLLNRAAKYFIGTYDFKAFCAKGGKEMETVRTIYDFSVYREGNMVYFKVSGNGFLYNMVRIMIGTLLKVQEGKLSPEAILEIIASKNRRMAGATARPEGLYLNQVFYGGEWFESK